MQPVSISMLTICGLDELAGHGDRAVTHVLSIIDPDLPDPDAFKAYDPHHRVLLRFNDVIGPIPGAVMPAREHVEAVLRFGEDLAASRDQRTEGHLLVHCHMGISRSTAAMTTLLAQAHPEEGEDRLFERLAEIRPQAWPNLRMIEFADGLLGRGGRLVGALARHPDHPLAAQARRELERLRAR